MADGKLRVELIFGAVVNHVAPALRGISAESERASKALAAARTQSNQLKSSLSNIDAFRAQQSAIVENNRKLDAAKVHYEALSREFMAAEAPSEKLSRSLIKQRDEVTRLTLKQRDQVQGLAAMGQKLDEAGLSTRDLGRHEERLRADLTRTTDEINNQRNALVSLTAQQARQRQIRGQYDRTQQLAGSMQGAGMSAVAAGGAVGAPIAIAARDAISFENVMLDVRKVVDFETPRQFDQMGDDILNLSTRIPIAGEGIAQIVAAAGQARIPRQELLGFAEDAGKMGVAFDITAEEAGKTMATWRTAFAMTQPQARGLADQVNMLGDSNNATAAQISAVLTRIGPLGAVAGLAAAEVAALSATTVAMGVNEEIAATGVKNLMLALTKGEAATKAQKTAFSALGLEASAVSKSMQRDAGAAITDVLRRVSQLEPERQSAILTQLFGSESVAALAPLVNGLDEVTRNLNAVGDASNYAGSMQREFDNRNEGAAAQIELARNSLKAFSTDFGQIFLPQIKAGANFVSGLANGFRKFAEAHPGLTQAAGALLAVVAGGLLIFGGLAMGVAAVLGPFALLRLSLAQTLPMLRGVAGGMMFVARGAQWLAVSALSRLPMALGAARTAMLGFNVAMLANPITLIVLAVAGLAAGAYLIYRNWGRIGPWLGGVWTGIRDGVAKGVQAVTGFLMNWTPLGPIVRNWGAITGFLGSVWTLAAETVGLGLDALRYLIVAHTPIGWIMRNWEPIVGFVGGVWDRGRAAVSAGLAATGAAILNFTPLGWVIRNWEPIVGFVGRIWSSVRSRTSGAIGAVGALISAWSPLPAFQSAFQRVFTWLSSLPGVFLRHGQNFINGLISGVTGRRAALQAATADATRAGSRGVTTTARIQSPSRLFAEHGRDLMAGLVVGIRDRTPEPMKAMARAATGVAGAAALALTPASVAAAAPTTIQALLPTPSSASAGEAPAQILRTVSTALVERLLPAAPQFVQGTLLRPPSEIQAEARRSAPPSRSPTSRSGERPAFAGATFHITIQVAPGQDPRDAARALMDEVESRGGRPPEDGGNASYEDDVWGEE